MKKIFLLVALLFAAGAMQAQSWKDALKDIATEAVDQATGGKLTQYAIVGDWNYTAPGFRLEGEDVASNLGGKALSSSVEGYLEKGYKMAGIKPGACSFSFDKEGNVKAVMGGHELGGSYEFDPETHLLTLHFTTGKYKLGTLKGHAYISGTNLQILFPVTRLVEMISALGSRISSLQSAAKLLQKYENAYVGFEFEKK